MHFDAHARTSSANAKVSSANETLNETVKMCDGKKPRIDEI